MVSLKGASMRFLLLSFLPSKLYYKLTSSRTSEIYLAPPTLFIPASPPTQCSFTWQYQFGLQSTVTVLYRDSLISFRGLSFPTGKNQSSILYFFSQVLSIAHKRHSRLRINFPSLLNTMTTLLLPSLSLQISLNSLSISLWPTPSEQNPGAKRIFLSFNRSLFSDLSARIYPMNSQQMDWKFQVRKVKFRL